MFLPYFSRYSYSHLERSPTGNETLFSKETFEREAYSSEIVIQDYRVDNERFVEKDL